MKSRIATLPGRLALSMIGAALAVLLPVAQAQTSVIPQIADGAGWQTTIVLANTTTSQATATFTFNQDTTAGATQQANLTLLESVNLQNIALPPGGTVFLHTPGTSASLTQGWGSVQGSGGVVAYAIYTLQGHPNQDVTANGNTATSRILVPFDNTSGLATAVAVVNPTGASENVSVSIQTDTGAISTPALSPIPAQGHEAFLMPAQFPGTSGERGMAEFSTTGGSLAMIAIRANPTGAFTSSPVYYESGAPILGSTGGGGGGGLPSFLKLAVTGTFSPNGQASMDAVFEMASFTTGAYSVAALALATTSAAPKVFAGAVGWTSAAVSGQTITFNGLVAAGSYMGDSSGNVYPITSATATLTLTEGAASGTGTATGTITLVSSLATLSGPFTGTYVGTL